MKTRWFLTGGAAIAIVAAAVVSWVAVERAPDRAARPASPEGGVASDAASPSAPPSFLTELSTWHDNGRGGVYFAPVVRGRGPATRTIGTVRSDSDCTPDAAGLSHCRNEIELVSGAVFTIQDNHNMMANRCLRPGERVTIEPVRPGWVRLQTRS